MIQSDVVWIPPCESSFIEVSTWPDIHGHHAGMPLFERDPLVSDKSFNGVEGLFSAKDADHARLRWVIGHTFSEKAIRAQEPAVRAYIDKLICRLHQEVRGSAQGKVSLAKWFTWMAFDIVGDLTFGGSLHSLGLKMSLYVFSPLSRSYLTCESSRKTCLGGNEPSFAPKLVLQLGFPVHRAAY